MEEKRKPVLAIDIDEVLAEFVPVLAEFHNRTYGTSFTAEHFISYEFHEVWGGTVQEATMKVQEFFRSPLFTDGLPMLHGAYTAMRRLQKYFELHVVTSRQFAIQALTEEWINKHFTGVFTAIHFGNHYAQSGVTRSKAEICKEIGACMLVDDSVRYAQNCQQQDIPVILFGNYAWNAHAHDGLQRAHNWSQAVQMIFAYFPDHCCLSVTDHELHLKRRGMASKFAQKAKELLEDADGIKLRATGNAIPSLLQIVEELQGEGKAEILDIKTSSRQGPKPGDILGEMMVHVHRTQQAIEDARKHKFNL